MQVQTYSREEVAEIVRRYDRGDKESERTFEAIVRGYMREHNIRDDDAGYRTAVYAVRKAARPQPARRSQPVDIREWHRAQWEIGEVAKNIRRTGGVPFKTGIVRVGQVSDSEATRLACLSNPGLGEVYLGHPLADDPESYQYVKKHYADRAAKR